LWKIWNSEQFQKLRRAVLAGDSSMCQHCPLAPVESDLRHDAPEPDEQVIMDRPPITINYGADAVCNLSCPSCRNHPITIDYEMPEFLSLRHVVDQFPGLMTIGVSLFGDPFASKQIRDWLQESSKPPHVILWTNGLLLPRYWHTIKRKVTVICISVDGATKEVYEHLRRGGKWEDILVAIDFCRGMVADNTCPVQMLQYNYVVQTDNFRDMPTFVDLVRDGVSKILFTPIDPRSPITSEYWQHVNVSNPNHPDHAEFVRVLQDEKLTEPFVDLLINRETGTHPLSFAKV